MEPTVQFDPGRCVLVLGPQIAAACLALKEPAAIPTALSYSMLVEVGAQRMLDSDPLLGKDERMRKQSLLSGAYELEPAFMAHKVVESLRAQDKYEQWLSDMFSPLYSLPVHSGAGSVAEDLRQLQDKGVLLVYTYYDMIIDKALDTAPVLMDEEEDVKNWGSRKSSGVLHVHGVHSRPSSVMCDCVNYCKVVAESGAGRRLKEICRNRTVMFVGFDGLFHDPFIAKFASSFLSSGPLNSQTHSTALLLTFASSLANHPYLLKMKLPSMAGGLSRFLVPTLSPFKPAPREGVDPSKSLNTTLLYADKCSCSEAAERVKTMSVIKVHQLTISHEQQSHQLLLYLDREGLKNLWKILFNSDNSCSSPLHNGLLGVVLDSGVTVWCKPVTKSEGSANGETVAMAMEISSASSSHPTLSTMVSVTGSMWAPIATPSVVSQHQPPKQLVPSTSTKPTLPSPLITSHSSFGLNIKGLTPELPPRHVGLLTPHHAHKREVRRVQSERYNLSYQDRISDMKASGGKKNGVLIHRESAPEFVYTSEGTVAYRADSYGAQPHHHHQQHQQSHHRHLHSVQKPSAVSHPSPLVKDGGNLEHKIEYIDQFQRSKSPGRQIPTSAVKMGVSHSSSSSSSGGTRGGVASSESPSPSAMADRRSAAGGGTPDRKDVQGKFSEEKQKWIRDAKNWSKLINSNIHKLSSQQLLHLSSDKSSSSLNTNVSPEEQERILQQHFDLVRSQAKLVGGGAGGGASSLAVTSAMPKLPLSSLSSLSPSSRLPSSSAAVVGGAQTPTSSRSPHPSPRPSPNLSPLQLAAAAAGVNSTSASGSPKKSPVNPLLLGGSSGGSQQSSANIFSYFPPAALQSPAAASFLYSPSVSQYAAAAAMFNPFQAAVQLLSPQAGGNNNNKPPMLLTDPSLLQSIQQSLQMHDKVPCILPDGTVTLVPTNFGAQASAAAGGSASPSSQGHGVSTRDSPVSASMKSPSFKMGGGGGGGGSGEGIKRVRSPDDDADFRPSLPKRRRSSSLPDIAQLSQLDVKGVQSESIREDEEREGGAGESGNTKLTRPQMLVKQPRHRQTPPPNIIQIPQDMKMNDPMLGFPTPPQSSPLIGNFALSPFVLSTPTFQNPTPMTPVTPSQEPLTTEELRELVEASGGGQTNLPPSPEGTSLPPFPAGRGPIQLWQFLLDLLLSPDKQHMIQWTGNGYEFRILAPEEIAKLWGARKNKPRMNYDKLSRGLRYYYSKGIMDKVPGKKLTFKYTCDVQHYVKSRSIQAMRSNNFPNGTPTGGNGSGGGGGVAMGVASTTPTAPLIPGGGITISASAMTVDGNGSKTPSSRNMSLGSPDVDEETNSMNIILPQASSICSSSESEQFCQVEEV